MLGLLPLPTFARASLPPEHDDDVLQHAHLRALPPHDRHSRRPRGVLARRDRRGARCARREHPARDDLVVPVVDDAFAPSPDAPRVPVTTTTILVNNVPLIQFFATPTSRERVVLKLERANIRAATVDRRNELLCAEIEPLEAGNDSVKLQVTSLETEVDRLSQSFGSQKTVTAMVESNVRKAAEEHARETSNAAREIEQLRLTQRDADYDEIKRGLEIMKYVELAGLEGDLDKEDGFTSDNQLGLQLPNPNASKANAHPASSLEALLATKNKRILEELTKFRILHTELEASLQCAQDDLASTTQELEKHRRLNERLETDLLKIEQHGNGDATPADPAEDDVLAGLRLELGLASKTPSNNDLSTQAKHIPFTPSADTSILPIVTSQRDRFRQRNAELEEVRVPAVFVAPTSTAQSYYPPQRRSSANSSSELRAEIRSLQSDNLKPYEKVRYMQSYREGNAHSTLDPPCVVHERAQHDRADQIQRALRRGHEPVRGIPWWRTFPTALSFFLPSSSDLILCMQEAARAYSNLNPLERGVLVLTRAVPSNRRARNAFIVYVVGLHALVMFTLYECTASSSSQSRVQPVPYPW
ncbi:CASP C terminal-domain-containing protein [Lactarius deliciosus]|nr:CASP C terminal-domain-containing protein [Lactarius deliciosus]